MIILVGASGAGKSNIANILNDNGYNQVITYTTRPIRDGEQNHKNYHFISNKEFVEKINSNFFIEHDEYVVSNGDTWYYGTSKEDILNANKNDIFVLTPRGLRAINKFSILDIVSFYINVSEKNRLIRLANRGDNIIEILRRIISDGGLFKGIEDEVNFVINNDGCIQNTVKNIIDILNQRGVI